MKVVLLKDVKGTGKMGDIVNVADGYGKNFLIKNKLAKPADAVAVNENAQQKSADAFHKEQERLKAVEIGKKINNTKVVVKAKCGADGKIFGSVTAQNIADAFKAQNIEIDKKKIVNLPQIKQLGSYLIEIKLHQTVSVKVNVEVVGEN